MLEVGIVRRLVSIEPTELSVILKYLTYRGVLICLRVKNHTDSWGSLSQTIEEIGEKKYSSKFIEFTVHLRARKFFCPRTSYFLSKGSVFMM